MNRCRLQHIAVRGRRVDYRFEVEGAWRAYFRPECKLFFEYNCDVSDVPPSVLAIPFVANVAPLAWLTDATVEADTLDADFYAALPRIKAGYEAMFPHMRLGGAVHVRTTERNAYEPEREAALFSGGLDALTTYIRVKDRRPLLVTEYGWHEDDVRPSDVWEADKANTLTFAAERGLDALFVESNYGTFIKAQTVDRDYRRKLGDTWWHGLHHGLAILSAAVPGAYARRVGRMYIASSNSPAYPMPCASDPKVDNEFRFGTAGAVVHDGYELTRQDKVKTLVDYFAATGERVDVRVCFRKEANCCGCEKCLRTMGGILAEGRDPREFGFPVAGDLFAHFRLRLNEEVKFFSDAFISMYWSRIQARMRENYERVPDRRLADWLLAYDFKAERRKSLFRYRVKNFVPILKRKVGGVFAREA